MSSQRELWHSQNFIRRAELVEELLALTDIGSHDLVVEIGPGRGVITRELVKRAGRVIAVEQDSGFAEELSRLDAQASFELAICDFMEWQLPQEKYKVFSNIPFNYTADIVNKLTSAENLPTDMYLVMQEDAALRFAGMPYQKNSLISTLIKLDFSVKILRKLDQENFEPRPNVNVVFVHFDRHATSQMPMALIPEDERQIFRDFVVYGYTQWSPTVLEAFTRIFTERQRAIIAKSQKLEGLKPTDLTFDQWIGLYKSFRTYVSEGKKQRVRGSEKQLRSQQEKISRSHRTRQ